jgi:ribosome maturation factor RimP
MQEAIDGRKKFYGRLTAVAEGEITVEVDGKAHTLPLSKLRKARLEEEEAA